MAQPNQQDFQQLQATIAALTQALPNTNNALVGTKQLLILLVEKDELLNFHTFTEVIKTLLLGLRSLHMHAMQMVSRMPKN
jgi:hypothetical protein